MDCVKKVSFRCGKPLPCPLDITSKPKQILFDPFEAQAFLQALLEIG